jgi:uncharacterized membrane protein
MKEMKNPDKEDLRIQYQQCIAIYCMFDRHLWQVPSITILITSAIIGVAFGYLKNALLPSSIVLLFGMVLSFSMFIAVKKYKFFQYYQIERMREIEKVLSLKPLNLITGKEGMNPRNWIERRRAGEWIAGTVLFVFICLTFLLIFNVVNKLCN